MYKNKRINNWVVSAVEINQSWRSFESQKSSQAYSDNTQQQTQVNSS